MTGMARRVVMIADDLGLSEEVNRAILHAHQDGALTGAALMMGQPGTGHAVELARRTPSLEVGWHLHLNDSKPLTRDAWPWGRSPARAGFAIGLSPAARRLVRAEIAAQWRAYRATGLPCRFVNAHHHLHVHPFVRRTLLQVLPAGFSGWLRWGRVRFFPPRRTSIGYRLLNGLILAPQRRRLDLAASTTLWGLDRTGAMDAGDVARLLPTLPDGLHELVFHPRRLEGDPDTECLVELARRGVA